MSTRITSIAMLFALVLIAGGCSSNNHQPVKADRSTTRSAHAIASAWGNSRKTITTGIAVWIEKVSVKGKKLLVSYRLKNTTDSYVIVPLPCQGLPADIGRLKVLRPDDKDSTGDFLLLPRPIITASLIDPNDIVLTRELVFVLPPGGEYSEILPEYDLAGTPFENARGTMDIQFSLVLNERTFPVDPVMPYYPVFSGKAVSNRVAVHL